MELSIGKILEENLVQSAFQQTLGDESTFQQDNNLKHKAKYTLKLLTKKTVNVPKWQSYSLDCQMCFYKVLTQGCEYLCKLVISVPNFNTFESISKHVFTLSLLGIVCRWVREKTI